MDITDDASASDDRSGQVILNPPSLANGLAVRFGTPNWDDLASIAAACAHKAGIAQFDLELLARALVNVIDAIREEEGNVGVFNTLRAPWILSPEELKISEDIFDAALFLIRNLDDAPAPFDKDATENLYLSLQTFLVKSHLALELDESELFHALESREVLENEEEKIDEEEDGNVKESGDQNRKARRLSDGHILYLTLVHHWQDITGQPGRSAAWKNPQSGEGVGKLWHFMVEVCPHLKIKPPSIGAVDKWKSKLPKQS
jgi:hypothetical protein